tara:strand:- start:35 stop:568 length:534 start_codon:yes stop_codon:yes gene_type:complete
VRSAECARRLISIGQRSNCTSTNDLCEVVKSDAQVKIQEYKEKKFAKEQEAKELERQKREKEEKAKEVEKRKADLAREFAGMTNITDRETFASKLYEFYLVGGFNNNYTIKIGLLTFAKTEQTWYYGSNDYGIHECISVTNVDNRKTYNARVLETYQGTSTREESIRQIMKSFEEVS